MSETVADYASTKVNINNIETDIVEKLKKISFIRSARLTNVNYKTTEIMIYFHLNAWYLDIREILKHIPESIYKIKQCNIHYSRHSIKIILNYK